MGIFGLNVTPIIFGEGRGAYIRLQLDITRTSTEQSIFAWGNPYNFQVFLDNASVYADALYPRWATEFRCLFVPSPDRFAESVNIVPFSVDDFTTYTHPDTSCDVPEYTPTDYGVQIHLPLYMLSSVGLAALSACRDATAGELVSLIVRRREPGTNRVYVGVYT